MVSLLKKHFLPRCNAEALDEDEHHDRRGDDDDGERQQQLQILFGFSFHGAKFVCVRTFLHTNYHEKRNSYTCGEKISKIFSPDIVAEKERRL